MAEGPSRKKYMRNLSLEAEKRLVFIQNINKGFCSRRSLLKFLMNKIFFASARVSSIASDDWRTTSFKKSQKHHIRVKENEHTNVFIKNIY